VRLPLHVSVYPFDYLQGVRMPYFVYARPLKMVEWVDRNM